MLGRVSVRKYRVQPSKFCSLDRTRQRLGERVYMVHANERVR